MGNPVRLAIAHLRASAPGAASIGFTFFLALAAFLQPGQSLAAGFKPATPTGDMPYVILTTAELARAFEPLAAWKTKTGLPAQVVLVEQIAADQNNQGSDLPEKIRIFLRHAYLERKVRSVLAKKSPPEEAAASLAGLQRAYPDTPVSLWAGRELIKVKAAVKGK